MSSKKDTIIYLILKNVNDCKNVKNNIIPILLKMQMKQTNSQRKYEIEEEIEHLCNPFFIKEIESIIKSLPIKKTPNDLGEKKDINFTKIL